MSTSIFATHCHDNAVRSYPAGEMASGHTSRERSRKFRQFGERLTTWRGNREIAVVARLAQRMGAKLSEPTLRGLEYGWTGSPDPIALAVLAAIYDVPQDEMLDALVDARNAAGEAIRIERRPTTAPLAIDGHDFGAVPLMKGKIAAGSPLAIDDHESAGALAFSATFLRRWKLPVCVRVGPREESMLPVIAPGDVVLLERAGESRPPDPTGIYAVRVDDGSTLKRVQLVEQDGRAWLALMSENSDKRKYGVRMVPVSDGDRWQEYLVGRVVWHGQYV